MGTDCACSSCLHDNLFCLSIYRYEFMKGLFKHNIYPKELNVLKKTNSSPIGNLPF